MAQEATVPTAVTPPPHAPLAGGKVKGGRSRWKRRLAVGLALALVVAYLAPAVAARAGLAGWFVRSLFAGLRGTVEVGGAELGWFSPVRLRDVEVRDPAGRTVLKIPRLESEKSLLALLRGGRDLGTFTLDEPDLYVTFSGASSNLETVLAGYLRPGRGAGARLPTLRLRCERGNVLVEDAGADRRWALDPVELYVETVSGPRASVKLSLRSTLAGTDGRANAELIIDPPEPGGGMQVRGSLDVAGLPLGMAEPVLRRLDPGCRLAGRLTARVEGGYLHDGAAQASLEGRVTVEGLDFALPSRLADRVRLEKLEVPAAVSVEGERVRLRDVALACDVGTARVKGVVELGRVGTGLLGQAGASVDLDVDLARLARLLPRTARLREGVVLTSGRLGAHLASRATPAGVVWEGQVRTTDLTGTRHGRPIRWEKPVSLEVAARDVPGGLPEVLRLECESDFLKAKAANLTQQITAGAECDLTRLREHLGQFIDLGAVRLDGRAAASLTVTRLRDERYDLAADVRLEKPRLTGRTGKVWLEDEVRLHGTGRWRKHRDTYAVEEAAVVFTAGADSARLALTGPVPDLRAFTPIRASCRISGDLARWRLRLLPWLREAESFSVTGEGDLTGVLTVSADAVKLEQARLACRDLDFRGYGLTASEPSLVVTAAEGDWPLAAEVLRLRSARLECPTARAEFPALEVGLSPRGEVHLAGKGTAKGELARVAGWFDAELAASVSGAFAGDVELTPGPGLPAVALRVTAEGAAFGPPGARWWKEPRLGLVLRTRLVPGGGAVRVEELAVEGEALRARASGTVTDLDGAQVLELSGRLDYDLAKLGPRLRAYLGGGVHFAGRGSEPFRLRGSLAAGSPSWSAELGLGWESLRAYGCEVGPARVSLLASDGLLRVQPVAAALNGGRVQVGGTVRSDGELPVLHIDPGSGIAHARITPAMCSEALAYVAPVLAGVARAEGEVSLNLDRGTWAFERPGQTEAAGQLVIHSARLGPSPLVRLLTAFVKQPPSAELRRESVVPFRVAGGRVYHDQMELNFGEVTVRTSGSVGLADGSLDLVAEMPVPPKWLEQFPRAGALAGRTVRVAVRGTLAEPRVDEQALRREMAALAKEMAGGAARDALREGLEKGLQRLLPKK